MQYLKSKVKSISNFMFKGSNETSQGTRIIKYLLTHLQQDIDQITYYRLAELSQQFHEYTQIFNLLISKLEEFNYETKKIQMTLKILHLFSYLIKSGNIQFAQDVKKNIDLLQNLQKIDTHYFRSKRPSNLKKVQYNLELVRHLAKHIELLVQNLTLLQSQRKKTTKRIQKYISRLHYTEETSTNLKISPNTLLKSSIDNVKASDQNNMQHKSYKRKEKILKNKIVNEMQSQFN